MGGVSHSVLFSPPISDKMFPALGFGAQLPPDWKVSEAGCLLLAEVGLMCVTSPRSALERSGAGTQSPRLLRVSPELRLFLHLSLVGALGLLRSRTAVVSARPSPQLGLLAILGRGAGSCETKAGFLGRHHDARRG